MANMMQALGMIETKGLVASIEAADAMVKAANVTDRQGARGRRPATVRSAATWAIKPSAWAS